MLSKRQLRQPGFGPPLLDIDDLLADRRGQVLDQLVYLLPELAPARLERGPGRREVARVGLRVLWLQRTDVPRNRQRPAIGEDLLDVGHRSEPGFVRERAIGAQNALL